jgi:hypothetical protein
MRVLPTPFGKITLTRICPHA